MIQHAKSVADWQKRKEEKAERLTTIGIIGYFALLALTPMVGTKTGEGTYLIYTLHAVAIWLSALAALLGAALSVIAVLVGRRRIFRLTFGFSAKFPAYRRDPERQHLVESRLEELAKIYFEFRNEADFDCFSESCSLAKSFGYAIRPSIKNYAG